MTDTERIEHLANILRSYAPIEHKKLVDNFTSKADTNDMEILISLVGSLYDGLCYGNWPWTKY